VVALRPGEWAWVAGFAVVLLGIVELAKAVNARTRDLPNSESLRM